MKNLHHPERRVEATHLSQPMGVTISGLAAGADMQAMLIDGLGTRLVSQERAKLALHKTISMHSTYPLGLH